MSSGKKFTKQAVAVLAAAGLAAALIIPEAGADQPTALDGQFADQANAQPGDSFMVGDIPTTLCSFGNGYGIHMLAAGEHTSCELAGATFTGLIDGNEDPRTDVRWSTPAEVDAFSPVTEQNYRMTCSTDDQQLVTCTGGVGAAVYMY